MPIALYLDHHVPRAITLGLRLRGVEVITAYEVVPVSWRIRHYWTEPENWGGFFSPEMMIYWLRLRNDKEMGPPFVVSFTPINSGFR
jgi:hypothetical protein